MSQPSIKAPPFVRYVMYFNGQNAAAVVPPNPAFYGSQLTVVAWFAIISNPGSWAGIVDTTVYGDKNWGILTGPSPSCSVVAGARYSNGGGIIYYPSVNCGEVHQYVLRINGNEVSAFLDGKLYQTQPGSGSYVTDTSLPLVIGGRPHGPLPTPPYYFSNVAVWQVLVYNRALSDAEIAQLYSNPTSPITSGLVLWLQADPAYIQGNTWVDLSGNNNNATLYNAQLVQLVTPSPSPTISPISPSPTISPTLSIAPAPTSPTPPTSKPMPWLWVGIGVVAAIALGAGLYVAHKKGLI